MPQLSGPFLSAPVATDPGLSDQTNLRRGESGRKSSSRRFHGPKWDYFVDTAVCILHVFAQYSSIRAKFTRYRAQRRLKAAGYSPFGLTEEAERLVTQEPVRFP